MPCSKAEKKNKQISKALFALFPIRFPFMSKYGYAHGRVSHMQKSSAMKVTEESLRNIYLAYHPVSNELGGVEVNRWEGKKTHLQGRG